MLRSRQGTGDCAPGISNTSQIFYTQNNEHPLDACPMLAPHDSQSLSARGLEDYLLKPSCKIWACSCESVFCGRHQRSSPGPRNELPLSMNTSSDFHDDQFPCLTNYLIHFHRMQCCKTPLDVSWIFCGRIAHA